MAKIGINLFGKKCFDRNIPNQKDLEMEVQAWCDQSNAEERKIQWRFTKYKADKKLSKYYVS